MVYIVMLIFVDGVDKRNFELDSVFDNVQLAISRVYDLNKIQEDAEQTEWKAYYYPLKLNEIL